MTETATRHMDKNMHMPVPAARAAPAGGRGRSWLPMALLCAVAVAATFFAAGADGQIMSIRVWTLRFVGAGMFFFCLGMGLRSAALKSVMFSLLAVFAALAGSEWYLNRADVAAAGAIASRTPQTGEDPFFITEFAEELLGRSAAPIELETDPSKLPTRYITGRNEIVRYKSVVGADDPEGFLPYAEEFTDDPVLGYRAVRHAARVAAIKLLGDHVVYDATYTLLPTGWRAVPQHPDATRAVVFFGCSFTFGEGLNDPETYPYQVAERLGPDWQVFNFGFHGYGAHQMLAMIENGYLDDIAARYSHVEVFFMTIAGHELRCSGKSTWDKNGPAYVMTDDGGVRLAGTFAEMEQNNGFQLPVVARLGEQQRMENLHIAIMKQADRDLRNKYNLNLNIIARSGVPYVHRLHEEKLTTLDATGIGGDEYIIKYDGHPNGFANSVIADRIVDFINRK